MREIRRTPEIEALLEREALHRSQTHTFKQLAAQTGLSKSYLRDVVAKKMRKISALPTGPLEPDQQ